MTTALRAPSTFLCSIPTTVALVLAAVMPAATAAQSAQSHDAEPARLRGAGPHQEAVVLSGGCFWGWTPSSSMSRAWTGGLRLCGRRSVDRAVRDREHRDDRTRGIRGGHLRSVAGIVRRSAQGILLRRARSDGAQPPGARHGTQYRSAIFFTNADQKRIADAYIAQLDRAKAFSEPIVTQVVPLKGFYPAEAYHQDYAEHHPNAAYIAINDRPKVERLRAALPNLYRDPPVLTTAGASGS